MNPPASRPAASVIPPTSVTVVTRETEAGGDQQTPDDDVLGTLDP